MNELNRKYLFQLNHPAHYHLFKNTIKYLRSSGNKVYISIKNKDILKDLLDGEEYFIISDKYRKHNILSIINGILKRDFAFLQLVKKLKPDLMIGTSPEIGHIRFFVNTPAIFFGEDDVTISKTMLLGAMSCYPFFDCIVSPKVCNNSIWNKKTVFYNGYQKLAYLHPGQFMPNREKVNILPGMRYYFLRFADLRAYHDFNAQGITDRIAYSIIDLLKKRGRIMISSERELPDELKQYQFPGNISEIHHYLYYADLYIGDSQSMAVEAAILGTPAIRFNNFAGKISVLEELEHKFQLAFGFKTNDEIGLLSKIREFLSNPDLKDQFKERRDRMLSEKINVCNFMNRFIENYPNSRKKLNDKYENL